MFFKCSLLVSCLVVICTSQVVIKSIQKFSGDIYKALDTTGKNVVCSPFSIYSLLALLYHGSAGKTRVALQDRLNLPSKEMTANEFEQILKYLNTKLNSTLEIANGMLVAADVRFHKNFATAAAKFAAVGGNIDFRYSKEVVRLINEWVTRRTHGHVTELVTETDISGSTRTVLLNAVYFKGNWLQKFNAVSVVEPFYVNYSKPAIGTHMMVQIGNYYYAELAGDSADEIDAEIVKLKFSDSRFSLHIVLPRPIKDIDLVAEKIAEIGMSGVRALMRRRLLRVTLPRFKIEEKYDLQPVLEKMGLGELFSGNVEVPSLIANSEHLTVDKIVHKAVIEINEEGGEATAVKGGTFKTLSRPEYMALFTVDHPFLYILTAGVGAESSGRFEDEIVLFEGKVTTPEIAMEVYPNLGPID